ncbi:MAG TPA: hypothetical protein VK842_08500 [bacterium]|jgi:hypothetical protein|nr:hypothetical protein [bacterium]
MTTQKIMFKSALALGLLLLTAASTLIADDGTIARDTDSQKSVPGVLPSGRIVGVPIGTNVVRDWDGDRKVKFQFNNDGDRLGALYTDEELGADSPQDSVIFYFPSLKIDEKSKNILLDGKVIGNYGFHFGLEMIPGYLLKYTITVEMVDHGFDRSLVHRVSVYLEPKPTPKK